MRRIVELDGLRAFAIAAVIACHYYPFSTMLWKAPEFGWVGVDFFFVLSGFLITSILLQLKTRPHPYKVFYARRILRIFPPYYAVMVLVLLIAVVEHDSFSWLRFAGKALFLQSFSNEFHVMNALMGHLRGAQPIPNLFRVTALPITIDRFPMTGFSNSFGPTWSLSIEEWFYILWAPLVIHLRRRALCFTCVGVFAAAFLLRWLGFIGIQTYFDFFSRADVLLAGALLALWHERRRDLVATHGLVTFRADALLRGAAALCVLLLGWILFVQRPILGFEIRESLLFSALGLPLIAVCCAALLNEVVLRQGGHNWLSRGLRLKPLVAVGTVSYTLYLVHVPVYMLVNQAGMALSVDVNGYRVSLMVSVISTVLSLALAQLSFVFFEMPILNYKEKLTNRLTRPRPLKARAAGVN